MTLKSPNRPTLYFIGVTTSQSSIMKVFPKWADVLALDAQIVGYDAPLNAPPEAYETIVRHIKEVPLARGALVTTHKIDLLSATQGLFDDLDPYAQLCHEVSCISKREASLIGHAKDPITSRLAWQAFVEPGYWGRTGGQVLCLGAGGAAVAITVAVAGFENPADQPNQFIIVERDPKRLEHIQALHEKLDTPITFDYRLHETAEQNDTLIAGLPTGSMVINATGMGKDRPGSPITDQTTFPENGLVWELNYRGERQFLQQAKQQEMARNLTIEDGWVYFLHGWSQIIAEVFDITLTPEIFAALDEAASAIKS
ncbi:MAG: shikimate dehydrogenase [Chloroflexota bacterium]